MNQLPWHKKLSVDRKQKHTRREETVARFNPRHPTNRVRKHRIEDSGYIKTTAASPGRWGHPVLWFG